MENWAVNWQSLLKTNKAILKAKMFDVVSKIFIVKPNLITNKLVDQYDWNFSLSITESLNRIDMIKIANPFENDSGKTLNFVKLFTLNFHFFYKKVFRTLFL